MATSGSYSFTVTRDDVIRMAMLFIGKLGEHEAPSASETNDCTVILNMMVKQWMARQDFAPGLKMWTRTRGNLFLSASTGVYELGPSGDNWTADGYAQTTLTVPAVAGNFVVTVASAADFAVGDYVGIQLDSGDIYWTTASASTGGVTIHLPTIPVGTSRASIGNYVWGYTNKQTRPVVLETALLRDINENDVPLRIMTLQDYEALPSKTSSNYLGDPQWVYYEPQLTNGVLYLNVGGAVDVTKRIHIVYLREVQDFVNPTDNPDYSKEWYLPLAWGLAEQIAPMFNAVWTEEMKNNKTNSLVMAREANSEVTSLYFQCNQD